MSGNSRDISIAVDFAHWLTLESASDLITHWRGLLEAIAKQVAPGVPLTMEVRQIEWRAAEEDANGTLKVTVRLWDGAPPARAKRRKPIATQAALAVQP